MLVQGITLVSLFLSAALAHNHSKDIHSSTEIVVSTIMSTVYICPASSSPSANSCTSAAAASNSADFMNTVQPIVASPTAPSSSVPIVVAPSLAQTTSTPAVVTPHVTTSSSHNPIATPGGAGYSGKIQKGVVYKGDNVMKEVLSKTTEIDFVTNWSPVRPDVTQNIEYMPQLWEPPTNGDVSLKTFRGGTAKAAASGSKWLLAWGEAAKKDTTLMAQQFMSILQPEAEKLGLKIAAPSVLQNPMPHNKEWLTDFLNKCDELGCKISALTAHYWAPTGDPDWFKDFQKYINIVTAIRPNLPVFIDNLSMNGTPAQQLVFLQRVMPWAIAHPNIARVGLILGTSGTDKAAFDANGNLNELGRYWFGA